MIKNIIAQFLNISPAEADSLIKILAMENRFNEEQSWNKLIIKPREIKSQADFILFLQAVGQSKWFKGHDRSKFPANASDRSIQEAYYHIFNHLGLCGEKNYDISQGKPHFSVVLGASEVQVNDRVDMLKNDLLKGIIPSEKQIFGLGCNRELGVSVNDSESWSKEKLLAAGKEPTEMEMVSLITNAGLQALKRTNADTDADVNALHYQAINTTSTAKTREDVHCVKTADTALSLKNAIEANDQFKQLTTPIKIITYSKQPYVERQRRDIEQKLADNHHYAVFGVGKGVSMQEFCANYNSISRCLGEIARLINISFSSKNLNEYAVPLTHEEQRELLSYQTKTVNPGAFFQPEPMVKDRQNQDKQDDLADIVNKGYVFQ